VPYEERADYLLSADVAVSAHYDLIETRFSFRTRVLDYFWAGLPIITTRGDDLSDLIETKKAGLTTGYENVDDWVQAIASLYKDSQLRKSCAQNSADLRQSFYWSKSAEPIRQFCRNPHRLPSYQRVTMPSILERGMAVWARGGPELVLNRSKELIKDLLR
jgi:glycosyltransferase involved in cell wall biosynthesis